MRNDRNRTSVGTFLAILKDLHETHLHPALPFRIISTDHGLGITSQTQDFEILATALVGYARLIPSRWLSSLNSNDNQHTNPTFDSPLYRALRDCVSIIEASETERFVCWGTIALLNHDCESSLMLRTPYSARHTPKFNKTYFWKLQKKSSKKRTPKGTILVGSEVFLFYRACGTEQDFLCQTCLRNSIRK